jgi:hypothetical protein
MAYATGSASSCVAVLQALATFATSNGWSIDYSGTASGYAWVINIHKGSTYLNLAVPTGDGQIDLYGATGYTAGAPTGSHPNSSQRLSVLPGVTYPSGAKTLNAGPYTAYHFFSSSSGTYLHALIEVSVGVYAHIHAGALSAAGGASPATYLSISSWYTYAPQNQYDSNPSTPDNYYSGKPFCADVASYSASPQTTTLLGCTVDSTFRWFAGAQGSSPARLKDLGVSGYTGYGYGFARSAHQSTPNTFNGLPVLIPIPFFAERAAGNIYSYVGDAPDVRQVNMANNNAKDEITIGSDVWKLFPIIANNPTINTQGAAASSYPYGLAFKKSA